MLGRLIRGRVPGEGARLRMRLLSNDTGRQGPFKSCGNYFMLTDTDLAFLDLEPNRSAVIRN